MRRCEKQSVLDNTKSAISEAVKCETLLEFLVHKNMGPDLNRELWDCARLIRNSVSAMERLNKRIQQETTYEEILQAKKAG